MLVLARLRDESIIIDHRIKITIVDVHGDKVRLGIEAPKGNQVDREEIYNSKNKTGWKPELSFQGRATAWCLECMGQDVLNNKRERAHRFLEEALELVQSAEIPESEVQQLVSYVYGRPKGELWQEVGGVMVTLAVLCNTFGINLDSESEKELKRCLENIDRIRIKHVAKVGIIK